MNIIFLSVLHQYFFYNLDPDGNPHHLCFLSYRLPEVKPVIVPHGNAKSNQPFYPTLPSTKALISECKASGPKETLNKVSRQTWRY